MDGWSFTPQATRFVFTALALLLLVVMFLPILIFVVPLFASIIYETVYHSLF